MSTLMDLFQTIKNAIDNHLLTISVVYGESVPSVAILIKKATIENGRIKLLVQE